VLVSNRRNSIDCCHTKSSIATHFSVVLSVCRLSHSCNLLKSFVGFTWPSASAASTLAGSKMTQYIRWSAGLWPIREREVLGSDFQPKHAIAHLYCHVANAIEALDRAYINMQLQIAAAVLRIKRKRFRSIPNDFLYLLLSLCVVVSTGRHLRRLSGDLSAPQRSSPEEDENFV